MLESIDDSFLCRTYRKRLEAERDRYDLMLQEIELPWCWACGRDGSYTHKPRDWHGPWLLERAHVVNKPRRPDRRAIVILCSLCHKAGAHRAKIRLDGKLVPQLTTEHLLWIKRVRDPEYYDRAFMQTSSVRILPKGQKPPKFFLDSYEAIRNGKHHDGRCP